MKQDTKFNIASQKIYKLRVALNAIKMITKRGQIYDIAKQALK